MDSQFPNELWLEICALLPPEALRNLSSTHCALYVLARPLGFTEFKLDPYPVHYIPPKARLDAALERLEFWSSPKIAPHVRSCTAQYNASIWQVSERYYHSGPPVLVNAFFERLPKFTGLQRLHTDGIRWTQLGIVNLCALPALTHLESSADHVADGERINPASLTLHVSTFTTHYDNMNDIWISLLSRDSLRSLDLFSPRVLAEPGVRPFPHVHTLSVNELPERAWDTLAILQQFPALRVFVSDYHTELWNMSPAQASMIFPVLQKYTGQYGNLHVFVPRATLTHIILDSGFPFSNLVVELEGVAALPNITSLTACFTTDAPTDLFGDVEIGALFTFFPRLTALELTLMPALDEDGGITPQPTAFLKTLIVHALLPNTLQSLSLDWVFPVEYQYGRADPVPIAPDTHNTEIPDFDLPALRADLLARCPGLTKMWLDGYHFVFLWWEGAWEAGTYNDDDAEVLRAKKDELKDGPPVVLS